MSNRLLRKKLVASKYSNLSINMEPCQNCSCIMTHELHDNIALSSVENWQHFMLLMKSRQRERGSSAGLLWIPVDYVNKIITIIMDHLQPVFHRNKYRNLFIMVPLFCLKWILEHEVILVTSESLWSDIMEKSVSKSEGVGGGNDMESLANIDARKGAGNGNLTRRTGSAASDRPFIVSVEGNIGSGKSTMLSYFEKFGDVELVPEPVGQWCDLNGHNLLAKLYENPSRWSFQFQSYVQLTRYQQNLKP